MVRKTVFNSRRGQFRATEICYNRQTLSAGGRNDRRVSTQTINLQSVAVLLGCITLACTDFHCMKGWLSIPFEVLCQVSKRHDPKNEVEVEEEMRTFCLMVTFHEMDLQRHSIGGAMSGSIRSVCHQNMTNQPSQQGESAQSTS